MSEEFGHLLSGFSCVCGLLLNKSLMQQATMTTLKYVVTHRANGLGLVADSVLCISLHVYEEIL